MYSTFSMLVPHIFEFIRRALVSWVLVRNMENGPGPDTQFFGVLKTSETCLILILQIQLLFQEMKKPTPVKLPLTRNSRKVERSSRDKRKNGLVWLRIPRRSFWFSS